MAASTSRRAGLVLLMIAAAAGALAILVYRLDAGERDRDAVRVFLSGMEETLLAPDGAARLLHESAPPAEGHAAAEPGRDSLRSDLDRLARLDKVQILPGDIDVQGETARVDYRLVSRPRFGDPSAPFGGQLVLRRTDEGWRLTANRFLVEPPQDAGPVMPTKPRAHPRTHAGLTGRLAGIAVVALLAGSFLLIQPLLPLSNGGRHLGHGRR